MQRIAIKGNKNYNLKRILSSVTIYVLAIVLLIIFTYPLVYTIVNSLKTYDDFIMNPQYALPEHIHINNYIKVAQNNFARYFMNSVVIAVLVVIFTVSFSALAAFAISKFIFKFSKFMEVFFLLGLMIPYQVVVLPLYLTYTKLNLLNTFWSLVIPQVAFGLPFSVQLFIAFFRGFEDEMLEAAIIDGCSIFNAFIRIVVPLCQNIIITISTLRAIFSWNEYIFSYTFISSRKMLTVVLGLNAFVGEEGAIDWGPTFAAISITIIPTLVAYLFLSKYMQAGLSEGAVKG